MLRALFLFLTLLLLCKPARADQRFAIETTDGVEIMQVVPGFTPEDAVAKWTPEHRAKVLSITQIDTADIPTDRTLRGAWKIDKTDKKVKVDMSKARGLFKERLGDAAVAAMDKLDKEERKATAIGDSAALATVATKKNAMKNLVQQSKIDAAETPEELMALWPTNVPKEW